MNELYNIVSERPVEIEETYLKKDAKTGKSVEAKRKKKTKEETNLVFVKPTTAEMEDAEFFFGQQFNKYVQAGFMTRAMLQKKFSDVGGLAENDEGIKEALKSYMEAVKVIQFYEGQDDLTPEKQELLSRSKDDFIVSQQYLFDFQSNMNSQFSQTADVKAEQKLIEWLLLNFLYIKEKKDEDFEYFPFFDGVNYEEKKSFYLMIQEDSTEGFDKNTIKKKQVLENCFDEIVRAISIWHGGQGNNQEEIETQMKELFGENK